MVRLPYSQIDKGALPPRISVLGYVKVGGLRDRVSYTREGKPWVAPERFTDPVRFEITTREQEIREVKGKPGSSKANDTFKVGMGYVRDERIHQALGNANPSEIEVRFMFPKWEQNFICHFGAHDGKRWVCQGNGVEAQDHVRGAVPCPCPRLKQFEGVYTGPRPPESTLVACKPRGVLSMILPEAETFGGFHVFKTTSWESIANLRTQLELFEAQFGRLDGLPFRLKVYPATKSYDNGAGTTTQPIVTLVIPASFDTARQLAAAAADESRRYLLAAGGAPDPEQHRTVLVREMAEEAEAEGREFFPQAGTPGSTSLDEINERIRAKREGRELPVVQAPSASETNGDEAHYEIVDDGPDKVEDEKVADPELVEAAAHLRDLSQRIALAPNGLASIESAIEGRNLKTMRAWITTIERRLEREADTEEEGGPAEGADAPSDGSPAGKALDALNREYFALLTELAPELAESDTTRRLWQLQRVGKSSCSQWEAEDYELAILLLRRGRIQVDYPPRTEDPRARVAQASLPGV